MANPETKQATHFLVHGGTLGFPPSGHEQRWEGQFD